MARKFTLVLLLGSVVAVPAGADVMFFGCANSKTGRVRSIKTKPPKCRSIETRVSWNALGPKGNPGPPGPQGPAAGGVTVRDASEAVIGAWKPEPANAGQAVRNAVSNRTIAEATRTPIE